jgi:hypothetical protein
MTTTTTKSDPMAEERRRQYFDWAVRTTGLDPAADARDRLFQLLRRLERDGFLPWAAEILAVRTFCEPALLDLRQEMAGPFVADLWQWLAPRVDRFCADFFTIAPAERRAQWNNLRRLSVECPPLRRRLDLLHPGLSIDVNQLARESPDGRKVADFLCELFVLHPAQRAARRRAFFSASPTELAKARHALRRLRRRYREITALEPALIARLLAWRPKKQKRQRVRVVLGPVCLPKTAPAKPKRTSRGASFGGTIAIVLVSVIAGLLRNMDKHPNHEYKPPNFQYTLPKLQYPIRTLPDGRLDLEPQTRFSKMLDEEQRRAREASQRFQFDETGQLKIDGKPFRFEDFNGKPFDIPRFPPNGPLPIEALAPRAPVTAPKPSEKPAADANRSATASQHHAKPPATSP